MLVVVERRVEDKALQLACVAGAAGAAAPILTFHFFRLRLRRACFSSRGAMEISVRLDTLDSREGTPLWHGRVTPSPDVCETHPSLPCSLPSASIAVGSFDSHVTALIPPLPHSHSESLTPSPFLSDSPEETLLSPAIRHHQSSLVKPRLLRPPGRGRAYFPKNVEIDPL